MTQFTYHQILKLTYILLKFSFMLPDHCFPLPSTAFELYFFVCRYSYKV